MIERRKYTTTEEAEAYREYLVKKAKRIELDLSDKNQTLEDGTRVESKLYHAWRQRACGALHVAQAELSRTKKFIKEQRKVRSAAEAGIDPNDPMSLIRAAEKLLRKLASEGVDLDPSEYALIDALQNYRHHVG